MKPPFGLDARSLTRVGCIVISLAALAAIYRRIDFFALVETLSNARLHWFFAALGSFGAAVVLAAMRWHVVLRSNHSSVHASATLRTVFIGHLFNTFLFGPAGGDLAKSVLYARWYKFQTSTILGTCVLDRLLGGAGFILFGALAVSVLLLERNVALAREIWSPSKFWAGLGAGLMLAAAAIKLRRRLRDSSPLRRIMDAFVESSRKLMACPRDAIIGLLAAFVSHVCMNAMFVLCLQAVTRETFSLAQLLWTFPVISLISSAPIAFAGTGLREGAALVLLGLYGIPEADAVASSLLVLIIYLLWAGVAGFLWSKGEREFQKGPELKPPATISAIIPTLNESAALPDTVRYAREVAEISEIIVVDGGSADGTAQLAREFGCQVLTTLPGRGGQMRVGTEAAQGDVILLLHADTWLPKVAGVTILNCLRDRSVAGGGFWKSFRDGSWLMAGSRFRCWLRLILARRVLGDQCLFVRREALQKIGGVPDMPLMEEFELCRRLRAVGRLALATATVQTSARRFWKQGVLRTYWRMWRVTVKYYSGVSPHELRRGYEKE